MKKLSLIIALMATVLCTAGARSIADLFRLRDGGIQSAFPYLDYNARMDMIDYREAGMTKPAKDVMYNTEITMDSLTDNYFRLRSPGLSIDAAMCASPTDTLIVVVRTVGLGDGDSDVSVYDVEWRPAESAFEEPEYTDWLVKDALKTVDTNLLLSAVPYVTYIATVDPSTATLTLTNTASTVKGMDAAVADAFKPQLTYVLKNKKFKPVR